MAEERAAGAAAGAAGDGMSEANPVSAAFVAAGIGLAVMGVLQFAGELSEPFNEALAFNEALGPYSGKYVVSYAAWLVSWGALYPVAKSGRITLRTATVVLFVLAVVAAVLVFPPFIQLFTSE